MEFKAIWAVTWQNQQMSVLPAKTQISLGIQPVWSESLLSIIWNKGTAFEATLHNNCVDEVYLQLKGDMMNLKT